MKSLSLIVATMLLFSGCLDDKNKNQMQQKEMPPLSVKTQSISFKEETLTKSYSAILKPYQEVDVIARISGFLTKQNFKEGSFVKKGDLLYEIQKDEYLAALEAAKAKQLTALASFNKAQNDWNRAMSLYEKKAISTEQRDNAKFAYDGASAALSESKALLDNATLNYSYTTIKAPISGLIGLTNSYAGAYIDKTSNGAKLATITMSDPLYAEFSLPKADIEQMVPLIKDGGAKLTLVAGNKNYNASIEYIAPIVDPSTDTLLLRAKVENKNGELIVGNFAKLEVSDIAIGSVSVVPEKSVIKTAQASIVFVVDENSVANPRPVVIGELLKDGIAIKSGLKEGENIVISNIAKLRPGTKIQTIKDENKQ